MKKRKPQPEKIDAHKWPRDPNDWYVESEAVSIALFKAEKFHRNIVDPSAGTGRIIDAAFAAGYNGVALDLVDRVTRARARYIGDVAGGFDFMNLAWEARNGAASLLPTAYDIVSNPPFKLCAPRHYSWDKLDRRLLYPDLALRRMGKKCALILPAKYVGSSASRWRWLETTPLKTIYHIVPRPSMPPGDALIAMLKAGEKPGNGYEDFVCLVWQRGITPKASGGPGPISAMLDIGGRKRAA